MRIVVILLFSCLGSVTTWAQQQWTAQDSLWLKRVLAGQDTVKLDPEVRRAIERGELINAEPVGTPQLAPHADPPITKDFSEYIGTDHFNTTEIAWLYLSEPPLIFSHRN